MDIMCTHREIKKYSAAYCTAVQCYKFSVLIYLQVVHHQPVVVKQPTVTRVKPRNHLAFSILNIVLCCWCMGPIALVYSLKVGHLLEKLTIYGSFVVGVG